MKKLFLLFFLMQLIFSKAQSQNGNNFFGSAQFHEIYLNFSQSNWWDSLLTSNAGEYYIHCDAIINGVSYPNIGVKTKGNSSFNNNSDKKSFKLDFNEFGSSDELDGLSKLNLNNGFKDPTFLREKICLDFLNENGIIAPRATYANVYLNNVLWGVYSAVEEINKPFLDSRFGNNDGNLFKGDPHGDLKYLGTDSVPYKNNYELHTNEDLDNWNDLVNLTDKINNNISDFDNNISSVLNTSSFINNWAVYNLFSNLDSYLGSGHNYYIYHNTSTNKFEWLPWDVNEAFGNFQMNLTLTEVKNLSALYISQPSDIKPLEQNMLNSTFYKTHYLDKIYSLLNSSFDTAHLYPLIDSLANWVRPYVYADTKKFFTNDNFEFNINNDLGNTPGLKNFISSKINFLNSEMQSLGYGAIGVKEITTVNNFKIYPNPVSQFLNVESYDLKSEIEIKNVLGEAMIQQTILNAKTQIDISAFPSGIYFLKANHNRYKFVKL